MCSATASSSRHSGFAALIGAPNVGKSSLLNRLAGAKLAIVSPKPQTTRGRILGIVTRPEGQVAFIDTPGVHQAKRGLNRHLVQVALHALSDADLVLFMIEPPARPSDPISDANRLILKRLGETKKAAFLLINKIDQIAKPRLLALIDAYRQEFSFVEVVPVSAKTGDGVEELLALVIAHLPIGAPLFDEETLTDQAERALVAEYIREQVLRHCREEIPYSAAVTVDSFDESERAQGSPDRSGPLAGLVRIHATIHLERESQRGIVIGRGGQMLKRVGADARASIEPLLGAHVYLSLHVRVEPYWSERPEALRKLGYE
jgi:GTP-binding protein Era